MVRRGKFQHRAAPGGKSETLLTSEEMDWRMAGANAQGVLQLRESEAKRLLEVR